MNYRQSIDSLRHRLRRGESRPGAAPWELRGLLIGLMVPMGMTVLNLSMFGVAVPFIRDSFRTEADTVAWLVTAHTLPFVMFMPLYGRLGDGLGKRRLFTVGILLFLAGTVLCLNATSMAVLLVGRVVQGIGTAGVNPLCIAIISELFPGKERGRALGTWSSVGPATAMIAPFLGGFLVDQVGWHSVFWPGILAAVVAIFVVRGWVPKLAPAGQAGFLRHFDWIGMALLGGAIVGFVAYLSSRSLTGVEPLRDGRLGLATLILTVGFLVWERRYDPPLIPLSLFRIRDFSLASFAALVRMFLLSSEGFLIPLYMADVHGLSGSALGLVMTLHAGSLLATVRWSGRLADRWSRRWPIVFGFTTQVCVMVFFALLPAQAPLWIAVIALMVHGAGAGASLAVLTRTAMDRAPVEQSGAAAGLYSMVRFFGSIVGTTLGGVVLTQALGAQPAVIDAYQTVFRLWGAVGLLGVATAWWISDRAA
jgi:EmrB/QacA subfamily drug resistance transporter